MTERPMTERLGITPSQTVGPYFAYALTPGDTYSLTALTGDDLVTPDTVGHPIVIEGRIADGAGDPVPDCFLELWQADGAGRYPGQPGQKPNTTFKGFGRSAADKDGRYRFHTVKPGPVAGLEGRMQAPHINVGVFARGILRRMFTRIYFEDETANGSDAILALVPKDRRQTLIARRDGEANGAPRYVFDVRLHGDNETVFFEA
jgi:protocatechuate 3,4-dioxygenase, alpha subunit